MKKKTSNSSAVGVGIVILILILGSMIYLNTNGVTSTSVSTSTSASVSGTSTTTGPHQHPYLVGFHNDTVLLWPIAQNFTWYAMGFPSNVTLYGTFISQGQNYTGCVNVHFSFGSYLVSTILANVRKVPGFRIPEDHLTEKYRPYFFPKSFGAVRGR